MVCREGLGGDAAAPVFLCKLDYMHTYVTDKKKNKGEDGGGGGGGGVCGAGGLLHDPEAFIDSMISVSRILRSNKNDIMSLCFIRHHLRDLQGGDVTNYVSIDGTEVSLALWSRIINRRNTDWSFCCNSGKGFNWSHYG